MRRLPLAPLLLAPLLSGCVAAAALPLLAGGAMVAGGNAKIRAATPRPKPVRLAARLASERTAGAPVEQAAGLFHPSIVEAPAAPAAAATPPAVVPQLAPGAILPGPNPWQPLAAWAGEQASRLGAPGQHRSALFETGSSLALPRQRQCTADAPAVLIDLDRGGAPFDPALALQPAAGLAPALARLREAGVTVVWIAGLPAARVGEVSTALSASGLDPEGSDPLLLLRSPNDRKQALRDEANRDVCIVAIAGDGRSDFDELFDYLRDPASAQALDSYLGAGWFLTPPPLDRTDKE